MQAPRQVVRFLLSLRAGKNLTAHRKTSIMKKTYLIPFWVATMIFAHLHSARAAVTVTSATGGANISADTVAAKAWTSLTPITVTEVNSADFATGTNITLVLNAPSGFEFNSKITPSVSFTAGQDITAASVDVNSSAVTVTLTVKGTTKSDTLIIGNSNFQIQPSAGTPLASGNIYRPASGGGNANIAGISTSSNSNGSGGTSFGILSEIEGVASRLGFAVQPEGAIYNTVLTTQPVIQTQDQFGNLSTRGIPASLSVTTFTQDGMLRGTRTNDIGTAHGNGVITHTDLLVQDVISKEQIRASASGLTTGTSAEFRVDKADQTITFNPIPPKTFGDAPFTLSATASTGLTVDYKVISGPASIAGNPGNVVTITGVGTVVIQASQTGNSLYNPAPNVNQSFTVSGLATTITWATPADIVYGTLLTTNQLNAVASVPGTYTYNPPIGAILNAGSNQVLAVSFAPTNPNYSSNYQTVLINVARATPVLTWTNPTAIVYGAALGTNQLTATANVSGNFAYTPAAGTVLDAGTNALSAIFTPTDTTNYASGETVGTSINILKADLSVTANNSARDYGATNPTFTGVITGLQNGDVITAIYSSSATASSPPGDYDIVPTLVDNGGRLANYIVSSTNGVLTVNALPTPATAALIGIQLLPNGHAVLQLQNAATNHIYSIEATDALNAAWQNIGTATNVGETLTFEDVGGTSARFYRAIGQ